MNYYEDELERQFQYERLRKHKERVNKQYRNDGMYHKSIVESIDEFLSDLYDMAIKHNGEIKLQGVLIK